MSLNCLGQVLQRTNSSKTPREYNAKDHKNRLRKLHSTHERIWSENLKPPIFEKVMNVSVSGLLDTNSKKKVNKNGHRRLYSASQVSFEGNTQPRLVRCSGRRRDWSFEDLKHSGDQNQPDGMIIMMT